MDEDTLVAEKDLYALLAGALPNAWQPHCADTTLLFIILLFDKLYYLVCENIMIMTVRRDASDEDIKRAYRNLAQLCHPDKHKTAGGQEA